MVLRYAGRRRGLALLLLVATLLWPQAAWAERQRAGVLPSSAELPRNLGLQGGWAVDERGNTAFDRSVRTALPLMQQAGAGWVRINFRLGGCYHDWVTRGCNGQSALEAYDAVVRAAEQQGLQVLGLISNESWPGKQVDWLANNAENTPGNGDNAFLRDFSLGAAVPLAAYFEGRITLWEVWNEPNAYTAHDSAGHYWGGSFIYPSNMAWLLRHVYEDVRCAGVRRARFVSGGLFSHDCVTLALANVARGVAAALRQGRRGLGAGAQDEGASTSIDLTFDPSGVVYLRATYELGRSQAGWEAVRARYGSYPLDGIGQHLYIDQGRATEGANIAAYLQIVRDAYVAYEGPDTPKQTYVTEFGWQTRSLSPVLQARNLQAAYAAFGAIPYVAQAYWFAVEDIAAASSYYGLVREDGAPKPAFAAYCAAAYRRAAGP